MGSSHKFFLLEAELKELYAEMLAELEAHPLTTILVPSKRHDRRDSDMIRVNLSEPPPWYRKLCAKNLSKRAVRRGKPDTRVRRANILSVLTRLSEGLPSVSQYVPYLRAVARNRESVPF